jgi:hypothetical protein
MIWSQRSILFRSYGALSLRRIQINMGQANKIVDTLEHGKNPNFLLVVVLSGLALIGLFVVAWLLVGDKGRKLLPALHHDPQPTSSIHRQAIGTVAV